MSERFTKWEVDGCASVNGCSPIDADMANAINRLCDLEDKIEQGKILELPCKVGQTVYRITNFIHGETLIVEGEVFEFTITNEYGNKVKNRFYFYAKGGEFDRRAYSLWCDFDEFGKTVFPDRIAAEAKLREMEGERE